MLSRQIIGIMGPGEGASDSDIEVAFELGRIVSRLGFTLLTGGRNCGVMEAAMQGAKEHSGLTIGILPDSTKEKMSRFVDIPIVTGMGNARNAINILSSTLILVVGEGPGTLSEVALAIKSNKPVIWLNYSAGTPGYFKKFQNASVIFIKNMNNQKIEQLIKKLARNT